MESKRLRRDKARESEIYQKIKERCEEYLKKKHFFKKTWVLKDLDYEVISDSIRWDYIVEWVTESYDCELAPLAEAFFKRLTKIEIELESQSQFPDMPQPQLVPNIRLLPAKITKEQMARQYPARFLASGHGKKTTGYASVEYAEGAFHLKRLSDRKSVAKGFNDSSDKFENQLKRAGVIQ